MKQAWRPALDPKGEWIPAVLRAADQRLYEVRRAVPAAGGLVLASHQGQGRTSARHPRPSPGRAPLPVPAAAAHAPAHHPPPPPTRAPVAPSLTVSRGQTGNRLRRTRLIAAKGLTASWRLTEHGLFPPNYSGQTQRSYELQEMTVEDTFNNGCNYRDQ